VHTDVGHPPARPDQGRGLLEGLGDADRLDGHVRAEPVGQSLDDRTGLFGRGDLGDAERAGPLAPGWRGVDGHDRGRGVQLGAEDGGQADGAGADDRDGVAWLDAAVEDADLVAGGQDVGQVDGLLVGQVFGELVGGGVGERDAGVLGLDAVDQVPEDPAAAAQALAVLARAAEAAAAAGGDARQQHPVALTDRADARPGLQDRTDGLVAEDPARGDLGHVALEDVQVGAADGDGVHPHDRVGVVDELGVGNLFPPLVPWAVVDDGSHGVPPSWMQRVHPP
jgi:hypothetical protein